MGEEVAGDGGVRPKSALRAVFVYFHHRSALEYDFRARFGFGVDKIDRGELPYQGLVALTEGLLDDHSSHTFASVKGWAYVPTPEEVAFYDDLDVKIAMNRQRHQPLAKPIERPWERPRDAVAKPVSDESRERRTRLAERLGIKTGLESQTSGEQSI